MKFVLGTVQFGMAYGVANRLGQVDQAMAELILLRAHEYGVDTIDTAILYGKSESLLGEIGVSDFRVVTKLPSVPKGCNDIEAWVYEQCLGSMSRMKVDSIDSLLLHRSQDLAGTSSGAVISALQGLKADGLVGKVGVSIYSPIELEAGMNISELDLIQAPFNVIDRRLSTSGWLSKLHAAGIEVHARSVFLQGLLLMPEDSIPLKFSRWNQYWKVWHEWLNKSSISAAQACLAFVQEYPEVDKVVFGVDSVEQFDEIMDAVLPAANLSFPQISCEDELLINPSNWNFL